MLEKNHISRRDFLKLGLGTTALVGLESILAGCALSEKRTCNYLYIDVDTWSITNTNRLKYPLLLKILLKEKLVRKEWEESTWGQRKGLARNESQKEIYGNKTPTQPRKIKLCNEGEDYFLINGEDGCVVVSDSSGIIKAELTPNYLTPNCKPKTIIPLDFNDIINEEISHILLKKAENTTAKIGVDGFSAGELLVRGSAILPFEIKTMSRDDLENILSNFFSISNEFNRNIKQFTLYLRDIDSRVDLSEVKLKIKGENIPTPKSSSTKDLSAVFKGDLLKYINNVYIKESFIEYIGSEERIFVSDSGGKIQIPIYLGAQYSIELIHPKYNFAQEKITFDTRTPNEIPILMSELGTKVRVEILNKK